MSQLQSLKHPPNQANFSLTSNINEQSQSKLIIRQFHKEYHKHFSRLLEALVQFELKNDFNSADQYLGILKNVVIHNLGDRSASLPQKKDNSLSWMNTGLPQNHILDLNRYKDCPFPAIPFTLRINLMHNQAWISYNRGKSTVALALLELIIQYFEQQLQDLQNKSLEYGIRIWELAAYQFQAFSISASENNHRQSLTYAKKALKTMENLCNNGLSKALQTALLQCDKSQIQISLHKKHQLATKLMNVTNKFSNLSQQQLIKAKQQIADALLDLEDQQNNEQAISAIQLQMIKHFSLNSALLQPLKYIYQFNLPGFHQKSSLTALKNFEILTIDAHICQALFLSLCHFAVGAQLSEFPRNELQIQKHFVAAISIATTCLPFEIEYVGLLLKNYNQSFANNKHFKAANQHDDFTHTSPSNNIVNDLQTSFQKYSREIQTQMTRTFSTLLQKTSKDPKLFSQEIEKKKSKISQKGSPCSCTTTSTDFSGDTNNFCFQCNTVPAETDSKLIRKQKVKDPLLNCKKPKNSSLIKTHASKSKSQRSNHANTKSKTKLSKNPVINK